MIRIYTPKQWLGFFQGAPELVIEDSGLIYKGEEYTNFVRYPIGKVDYQKGKIFGENYSSLYPYPVAEFEKNGDVIKIYDANNGGILSRGAPVLYIVGEKMYSADEYSRIFSTPSAYVEYQKPKEAATKNEPTVQKNNELKQTGSSESGWGAVAIGVPLFLGIVGGIASWTNPNFIFTSGLMCFLESGVGAFFANKELRGSSFTWWRASFRTFKYTAFLALGLLIVETIVELSQKGLRLGLFLITPIAFIGLYVPPALIWGAILLQIDRRRHK